MARSRKRPQPSSEPEKPVPEAAAEAPTLVLTRTRVILAVVFLLTLHVSLAVRSLVLENPTIDEVIHLPAGISYWQRGNFGPYHHNPPLVKLIAALPVLMNHDVSMRYSSQSWGEPPNKAAFGHEFAVDNARNYFEIFTSARLVMPLFSVIGGLVVFFWSRDLYGTAGGLLSLALWVFCPNVLAHCRLVTTDMGGTSLGVVATYFFWRYLKRPSWLRACVAGVILGLAQLSKFSLILLYGIWPMMWLVHLVADRDQGKLLRQVLRGVGHGLVVVVLSLLVIDAGYFFEGVGIPLGKFEFVSRFLTVDTKPGMWRPRSSDALIDAAYHYRINRFRGTPLGAIPVPLPKHYLLGFDDQKFEAEGVPVKFTDRRSSSEEIRGYPVYLDGELRQKSWWYYYYLTLVYKVPEGTWALILASFAALVFARNRPTRWVDELIVLAIPAVILLVMSEFTNINLGLRYVLPVFPYLYIAVGKLVPWCASLVDRSKRRAATIFLGGSLAATVAATLFITPHYLAYFNGVSGGPANGSAHLIDSNLDWGQDLVGLRRWLKQNAPNEKVGLAYFGQINPDIFGARVEGAFDWFLPPPRPGTMLFEDFPVQYVGRYKNLSFPPGLYAVSATLMRGIPWRVYNHEPNRWAPRSAWVDAFSYFAELEPIDRIGYSIFIYRVTSEQAEKLSAIWKDAER